MPNYYRVYLATNTSTIPDAVFTDAATCQTWLSQQSPPVRVEECDVIVRSQRIYGTQATTTPLPPPPSPMPTLTTHQVAHIWRGST